MATTGSPTQPPPRPQIIAHDVEPERTGWMSWVTTTDHKRIGIMYLVLTFVFFILGGVEALLMRLQLGAPDNTLLTPQTYNELFTMHGTTMIFLFVVPIMAGFGNYFVPLMIGARDMAFPKLNALSFWLLLAGGLVFYGSLFFTPPEAGWTCYAPLSSIAYSPNGGIDAWIFLIHLTGISSLVGAINFYATIANMRAPGMGWGRLPLFVWSILDLLDPADPRAAGHRRRGDAAADRPPLRHALLRPVQGGVPLLWQHLFWFFGHPEVYIMVLPGFGDHLRGPAGLRPQADLRLQGDRRRDRRHRASSGCSCGRTTCSRRRAPTIVLVFFMISSFLIAIPTGVKIFNWVATLWRGTIEFKTPLLFAVGFIWHVPHRRHHRHLPRRLPGRLAAHRHVLRRRPPALRARRRLGLRDLRRRSTTGSRRSPAGCSARAWASRASGSCTSAST